MAAIVDGSGASEPRFDISFGRARIGFDGHAVKRVAQFVSGVGYLDEQPELLRLTDAIAVPRVPCLYDAAGARIPESLESYIGPQGARSASLAAKLAAIEAETCPPLMRPSGRMPVVEAPVLFLGKLTQHFGHVLADFMSRMWAMPDLDPDIRLLFVPAKNPFAMAETRVVLDLLGIDEGRLVRIREPTRFARVICPLAAIRWSERIYSAFDRPHRAIGRRLAREASATKKPVYLSRRGLGAGYRVIHGEDELETRLIREGFEIVRPETLPLARQAAIFAGDAPVVGPMGSALHSLLFRDALQPKRMAVLTDGDVHGRFLLFDAVKGAASHYLHCLDTPDIGLTRIQERTLSIDMPRAMEMLDGAGFFRRGVPGMPASLEPEPAILSVREELRPAAKATAYHKDNRRRHRLDKLRDGGSVRLRCPSGAIWLALIAEREKDRFKLFVVRNLKVGRMPDATTPAPEHADQPSR